MNTTNTTGTTVRRAAATAALVGAAILSAAPAHAAPAPDDRNSSNPSKALIEHRESEQRVSDGQGEAQAQQQAYLDELGRAARQDSATARAARAAFAAQQRTYAEHLAEAARGSQSDATRVVSASSATPRGTDDGVSVLVAGLLMLGGIALGTGATGYTAYRFRHHGPVGAATA